MNQIRQARDDFIRRYGFAPNAILLPYEIYSYHREHSHLLGMKLIVCDDISEPIAALIPQPKQSK